MITVTFFKSADYFKGFKISGHADFNTSGPDIVCAGVSSAAIMTANTITEVLHTDAEVTDSDGFINLSLSSAEAKEASHLIEGLWLHLSALQKQYKVTNDQVIFVEKLNAEANDTVTFDVIAVGTDDGIKVGTPVVEGAKVTAEVLKNGKGKKIRVATYKPKKGEKRAMGHRQPYTQVKITSIEI